MSAEPTLLLVPGLGCDDRLYAHQLAHLGEVARPVFAGIPDRPDVGAMAQVILASAPPTFALCGLSMGGYVAFEILRQAPERVTRLALLDTKADLDPPDVAAGRAQAIAEIEAGGFAAHIESRLPLLLGPVAAANPAICAVTRQMAEAVGPERYVRQQRAIVSRPDSTAGLAAIACPTLVLCGRDDVLTPLAKHATMAEAIPTARLAVIEECGHLSTIEQPVAATAMLRDWLLQAR